MCELRWEHAHAWVAEWFVIIAVAVLVDILDREGLGDVESAAGVVCAAAAYDREVDAFFDAAGFVDLG